MSPMTFIAVAIVVCGIVLVVASAAALMVEKPAAKRLSVHVWCPVRSSVTRVGVTNTIDRRLNVLTCEHFPDSPVTCDRSCIPVSAAA